MDVVAHLPADPQAAEPVQMGEHAFHDPALDAESGAVLGTLQPLPAVALELAHVAAEDHDGFVQIGGSPVRDFAAGALLIREAAAGALLVREAGGVITTLGGSDKVRDSNMVVAGAPGTCARLLGLLEDLSSDLISPIACLPARKLPRQQPYALMLLIDEAPAGSDSLGAATSAGLPAVVMGLSVLETEDEAREVVNGLREQKTAGSR